MDISADMVCGVTETDLKSDETSGVLLLYLNFLSSLCGNLNIDVNGEDVCDIAPSNAGLPDLRVQVATSPKIGIPWLMKLIQVNDRSIQLQTLKLLIQLATSWKTREIIKTGNIDVDGILCASLEGESQNIIKHIQQYIAKYTEILSFPYAVPEQAPKPQEQQQEQPQQQEQLSSLMPRQNGTAVRRDRRVRHKALKLTPDQVEAISTGSESGEKSPTRIAVLKSFILTERKYVAVLSRTLWMYFKPLYGLPPNPPKGLISSSVLRVVFSPMEQLTNVCATFVDIIEHRLL